MKHFFEGGEHKLQLPENNMLSKILRLNAMSYVGAACMTTNGVINVSQWNCYDN
jgi:hypothetical protein